MAKNKNAVSIDTNILLRMIFDDVPEQTKIAEKWIDEHTCHVADLALTETVFVLEKVYKMSRSDISINILAIIRNQNFNCNRIVFEMSLPIYTKNPSVSINDCLLATYAEMQKATPLYTFDKKLTKVYTESTKLA